MDQRSPGERLRERFVADLKDLNVLLDEGLDPDIKTLARRLASHVHLVVPGQRATELYDRLKAIAGSQKFPSGRKGRPA